MFSDSRMTENSMVQELVNMIFKYIQCDLPDNACYLTLSVTFQSYGPPSNYKIAMNLYPCGI